MTTHRIEPGSPHLPVAVRGGAGAAQSHFHLETELPVGFLAALEATGADVTTDPTLCGEGGRDWWPAGYFWARQGQVPARAGVVVRPRERGQICRVLAAANAARVPVTPVGGRSGVLGGSVTLYGGVLLDLTALSAIIDVDEASGIVEVEPGTFGDRMEDTLRSIYGLTVGHWPQSVTLSTVAGWVACRGAGQYSTRYGKIEDLVAGLDVVLADGTEIRTGGQPRQAAGPDWTQLFVGSEGTLGVISAVRLRARPVPPAERRAAYAFASFEEGLEAMRRILRRGATPAVLRLYDGRESSSNFGVEKSSHLLLVLDEGEAGLVDWVMSVVAEECAAGTTADAGLVAHWLEHRNRVPDLEALLDKGFVWDTMEVAGPWSALPRIFVEAIRAIESVPGTIRATAHQSHSYPDGGCLYFSFVGRPPASEGLAYYRAAWNAGARAALAAGGSISHHHGVGLHRAPFMREALGGTLDLHAAIKRTLDPQGILNPGKLGLVSPFGPDPWSSPG